MKIKNNMKNNYKKKINFILKKKQNILKKMSNN